MPITINQQLIQANSQIYKFENVVITKELISANPETGTPASTALKAIVQFGKYNENDERIDTVLIEYTGTDYNNFWTDFNTGKFLYDELNIKKSLSITIPPEVEQDFTNV